MKGVKAKDLDIIIKNLLESEKDCVYVDDLVKESLKDWSMIRARGCFKYLAENYSEMFACSGLCKIHKIPMLEMGEYRSEWEQVIEKGGFTSYWKEREEVFKKIKGILETANISATLSKTVFSSISSLL
ncbi:hypothetical protein JZ925_08305 [Riemerella anatipestifer]